MRQMEAEGVAFRPGVHVGVDMPVSSLVDEFDAVVLAGGAEWPRDLPVAGRDLDGVHFAMDFLPQQNRRVAGEEIPGDVAITATGKHVVVIGGGDTGSDCIGTSFRQGALSVTQLEILPRPPDREEKLLTWPDWPLRFRTSSSQAEGAERDFSVTTGAIHGRDGRVRALACSRVEWERNGAGSPPRTVRVEGGDFELPADLVLLAMGFLHPVHEGMLADLEVELDPRGNVLADTRDYRTSVDNVFACGDMRRGQSLVVWAIREGRQAARAVDEHLMGRSDLPR
jgi:glutamate synthase (NADPH/NADH) small chain